MTNKSRYSSLIKNLQAIKPNSLQTGILKVNEIDIRAAVIERPLETIKVTWSNDILSVTNRDAGLRDTQSKNVSKHEDGFK